MKDLEDGSIEEKEEEYMAEAPEAAKITDQEVDSKADAEIKDAEDGSTEAKEEAIKDEAPENDKTTGEAVEDIGYVDIKGAEDGSIELKEEAATDAAPESDETKDQGTENIAPPLEKEEAHVGEAAESNETTDQAVERKGAEDGAKGKVEAGLFKTAESNQTTDQAVESIVEAEGKDAEDGPTKGMQESEMEANSKVNSTMPISKGHPKETEEICKALLGKEKEHENCKQVLSNDVPLTSPPLDKATTHESEPNEEILDTKVDDETFLDDTQKDETKFSSFDGVPSVNGGEALQSRQ
ncbi:hypothetical protein HPP92_026052 [Vanilla planifolia]|uniref:Uncharacterized protein n=1 Tax=Vanilla planifolia TaxID=51239 RepID=A0A835U6U7_VANPL|nr:hypothetical protein HPP92_026052 [Vanilla planifolia]